MGELETHYVGNSQSLIQLKRLVQDYQQRSAVFVDVMNKDPNSAVPTDIYLAYRDSYEALIVFLGTFKQETDQAAREQQQLAQARIESADVTFYTSLVLAVVVAMLLGAYISSNIVNGIQRVQLVARNLAEGDLTRAAQGEGSDELADLTNTIAETTQRLSQVVTEIKHSANQVADNSISVKESNGRLDDVVNQVTENLLQVAAAIEEMSTTAQMIAQNTNETATASGEISLQVREGIAGSQQTVEIILNLVSSLGSTSQVISKLREETNNINQILSTIRSISEQTNLLALNAAIEAARAGESGRGFAVVADEVRTLAQRSQNSVNEIEVLLVKLNEASENAVEQMGNSQKTAGTASEQVEANNQMIIRILDSIEQVNGQTQQIATAAEEQSSVALDISRNVHAVQDLTNESANIAKTTSAASQRMYDVSQTVVSHLSFFKVR